MSRIGRLPVELPAGVTADISGNVIKVKGAKGELSLNFKKPIEMNVEGNQIHVTRPSDEKEIKALHGLYRALVQNMVVGVSKGYERGLVINGVGYKVAKQGNKIVMNIGFSHPVEVVEPAGITFECPSVTEITIKGIDKEAVGQCAASIRAIKKPEPYHAYGIHYKDEVIVRKEGKKNTK